MDTTRIDRAGYYPWTPESKGGHGVHKYRYRHPNGSRTPWRGTRDESIDDVENAIRRDRMPRSKRGILARVISGS